MSLLRRLDRAEAARTVHEEDDLAGRLERARKRPFQPTHAERELRAISGQDDTAGRIAKGWLALGPAFYLADAAVPARAAPPIDADRALVDTMGALELNPEGFADFQGWPLRKWQRALLRDIGNELATRGLVGFSEALRRAVSSGHGVGKSALVAILILWALSTHEDTRIVLTATTEAQVVGKSMPELAKWHRASINSSWFIFTATALYGADKRHEKNWRLDAVPWNESRPESFAGLHNQGKRIVLIMDEASGIADSVFQVGENALTDADTQMLWLACGNPTRATGYFWETLLGRFAHRWAPIFIDRRDVEGVSQAETDAMIEAYGIGSNYVRVRVLGLPPLTDDTAFFARAEVEDAMRRPVLEPDRGHAMIIGVDVARRGGDASVLTFRQHLDARSFPPIKIYSTDLMALAARVAAEANKMRALGQRVVIMADGTGLGAGVVDRLRQLGYDVIDVQFAAKASDALMYANLRAEMHGKLREAIRKGLALPNDPRLLEQMAAIEYAHTPSGQILLERKDDLRSRLGCSPDELDSLCCSFAVDVPIDVDDSFDSLLEKAARRSYDPYASLERGHDPFKVRR